MPWDKVGVAVIPRSPSEISREILLNRYDQHTQHCSSCRNALKTIELWQWLLATYFIAIVSVVAVMPDAQRVNLGLWLMISAVLGLGVAAMLRFWLMPKFYFVDYVHSER